MPLKKRIPLLIVASTFSIWLLSLLLMYIPISPWSAQTFPKVIDGSVLAFFLVATALSFSSSLVLGLRGILSKHPKSSEETALASEES